MSKVGKSSRHAGAVGYKPTAVTKYVIDHVPVDIGRILDFGSGIVPRQAEILRQHGYDVAAYDSAAPYTSDQHVSNSGVYIEADWKVIMLSNVLNVQDTANAAARLIEWSLFRLPNLVVFNLPRTPLYWAHGASYPMCKDMLLAALSGLGIPKEIVAQHPYSGGVVYTIATV